MSNYLNKVFEKQEVEVSKEIDSNKNEYAKNKEKAFKNIIKDNLIKNEPLIQSKIKINVSKEESKIKSKPKFIIPINIIRNEKENYDYQTKSYNNLEDEKDIQNNSYKEIVNEYIKVKKEKEVEKQENSNIKYDIRLNYLLKPHTINKVNNEKQNEDEKSQCTAEEDYQINEKENIENKIDYLKIPESNKKEKENITNDKNAFNKIEYTIFPEEKIIKKTKNNDISNENLSYDNKNTFFEEKTKFNIPIDKIENVFKDKNNKKNIIQNNNEISQIKKDNLKNNMNTYLYYCINNNLSINNNYNYSGINNPFFFDNNEYNNINNKYIIYFQKLKKIREQQLKYQKLKEFGLLIIILLIYTLII